MTKEHRIVYSKPPSTIRYARTANPAAWPVVERPDQTRSWAHGMPDHTIHSSHTNALRHRRNPAQRTAQHPHPTTQRVTNSTSTRHSTSVSTGRTATLGGRIYSAMRCERLACLRNVLGDGNSDAGMSSLLWAIAWPAAASGGRCLLWVGCHVGCVCVCPCDDGGPPCHGARDDLLLSTTCFSEPLPPVV